MGQINEQEFFTQIRSESLSIAHLIKHLSGNIKSRWTNFFTEDGEKPWRNRDYEFIIEEQDTRLILLDRWEEVLQLFFNVIDGMTMADLNRRIQIRWTDYSVMETILRHISHVAQHVGQITYIAKHLKQNKWQTLSIPIGKSEEFNEKARIDSLGK